ncbi:MAG: universal stress protein [Hyphomonadaceae bacterium]
MAYRSIVFVAAGDGADRTALEETAMFAARSGASLRVVPAFADAAANYLAFGATMKRDAANAAAEALRRIEQEAQARLEEMARAAGSAAGVRIEVEERALQPGAAVAKASVLADLVVFSSQSVAGGVCAGLFAETLLDTRAPVLLARKGGTAKRIAVAWDGSVEAGRALRAALPMLQQSEEVLILSNGDDIGAEAAATEQEKLEVYLARHSVANVRAQTTTGRSVAASLLDAAQRNRCDVLVSGAYGRPRLYEWILGGTTRALVSAGDGPSLLLAH